METPEDYILSHISPEPPHLRKLARDTAINRLYSRMCSGHLQGRILKMLTQMTAPKHILELGTFSGYSTLCFAEGAPEDAQITTVEIDDEAEDSLTGLFAQAGYSARIRLITGDAVDVLADLGKSGERFDLVFIDANKRQYPEYLTLLLPMIPKGGYIIADNTLWDGKVADDSCHDPQTEGIRRFNDMVAADKNLETVIIPLRDGLTIIRKLQ